MTAQILACDDDASYLHALTRALKPDFDVASCTTTQTLLDRIEAETPDAVLLDICFGDTREGLETLRAIRKSDQTLPIVIHSGLVGYGVMIEAMRLGATDYVPKGSSTAALVAQLNYAIAVKQVDTRKRRAQLIGGSPDLQLIRQQVARFYDFPGSVLLTGESGVGKDVIARMFERPDAPFVSVDSATINDSMAESTLFGHERGAFTGADRARCGLFEEADGGLLFFDEIGNMPLSIQNKLLRVLQEQEVRRLGCNRVRRANVRVIAATNADLRDAVKQGTFRFDLYARLSVFEIHIPSLRDRQTDILPLIWHISSSYCGDFDISEEALGVLFDYEWPGNVRELSHTLQFALAMAGGKRIEKEMLPPKMLSRRLGETPRAEGASLAERMSAYERVILHETYAKTKGNISAMARALQTDRASLYRKLRRHHLVEGQQERVAYPPPSEELVEVTR